MHTLLWFPASLQNFSPPPGGTRKQMAFKVLDALFPADAITALPPIVEHFVVAENIIKRAEGGTSGLPLGLSPRFAALIPGFPAFLTVHKKVFDLRTDVL